MGRRIFTAQEQAELLTPWLRVAAPGDISPGKGLPLANDVVMPGHPGQGRKSVQPTRQEPNIPDAPWVAADWRNATDGGSFRSSVRPPMSSDIPHPDDLQLSPAIRRRVMNAKDPENDPYDVLPPDVWFHDLVNNRNSHHENMTPEQHFGGRVWYRSGHDQSKDIAQKTIGHDGNPNTHERAVDTMAAFSPVKPWDENVEHSTHFLTHYNGDDRTPQGPLTEKPTPGQVSGPMQRDPGQHPDFGMPTMDDQINNAKRIWHGESGQDVLGGPKTKTFSRNLLDPTPLREGRQGVEDDQGYYQYPTNPHTGEPDWRLHPDQDVTVDTQEVRLANTPHGAPLKGIKYETPKYFGRTFIGTGPDGTKQEFDPSYDLHARAAWESTRQQNARQGDPLKHLVPKQGQAGPWLKFREDVDAANGKFKAEPGSPPKWFLEGDDPLKHPLNPKAIPRYQRDHGDWIDDRRPDVHLQDTPNWRPKRHYHLSWYRSAAPEGDYEIIPGNASKTQRPGTAATYRHVHDYFDQMGAPNEGGYDGVLDYGAGLGHSSQWGHTYEPYPKEGGDFSPTYRTPGKVPAGQFNRVTNLHVLNVVPPDVRQKIVKGIGRAMAPGGHAVIMTRSKNDVDSTKNKIPTKNGDPGAYHIGNPDKPGEFTYQKGFTPDELHQYVSQHLGPRYTVKKVNLGSAPALHIIKSDKPVRRPITSGWYIAATPERLGWYRHAAPEEEKPKGLSGNGNIMPGVSPVTMGMGIGFGSSPGDAQPGQTEKSWGLQPYSQTGGPTGVGGGGGGATSPSSPSTVGGSPVSGSPIPLVRLPNGNYTSSDPAWAHLINRESGGNPSIIQQIKDVNSGGNEAEGLFQITPATWRSHGGPGSHPGQATPEQQAQVAADIIRKNPSGSDWGAGLSGRENAQALLKALGG